MSGPSSAAALVEGRFAAVPAGAGWTPVAPLADPVSPDLGAVIDAEAAVRLASPAVAGSLMLLEYTRLLSWPVLACALRDGTWLDPAPGNVRRDPGSPRMRGLGFVDGPAPGPRDVADQVVPALLETHLEPLVMAVKARTRAGRRTLWSNVAAAIAGGYLALSWTMPDRAHFAAAARDALGADARLRGLVDVRRGEQGGQEWMRVVRAGCCLAFRCAAPHGHLCGTCPLMAEDERRDRFVAAAARYRELVDQPQDLART